MFSSLVRQQMLFSVQRYLCYPIVVVSENTAGGHVANMMKMKAEAVT